MLKSSIQSDSNLSIATSPVPHDAFDKSVPVGSDHLFLAQDKNYQIKQKFFKKWTASVAYNHLSTGTRWNGVTPNESLSRKNLIGLYQELGELNTSEKKAITLWLQEFAQLELLHVSNTAPALIASRIMYSNLRLKMKKTINFRGTTFPDDIENLGNHDFVFFHIAHSSMPMPWRPFKCQPGVFFLPIKNSGVLLDGFASLTGDLRYPKGTNNDEIVQRDFFFGYHIPFAIALSLTLAIRQLDEPAEKETALTTHLITLIEKFLPQAEVKIPSTVKLDDKPYEVVFFPDCHSDDDVETISPQTVQTETDTNTMEATKPSPPPRRCLIGRKIELNNFFETPHVLSDTECSKGSPLCGMN